MYLHAYPGTYPVSYPYTPYPGAYLEPVTPRPAPSTAMANNQEPFSTPGIMEPPGYGIAVGIDPIAPSPAVTEDRSGAVQHTFDKLSRAGVDYWISPADYTQLWSYLSSVAPDLAGSVASPADYATVYFRHVEPTGPGGSITSSPEGLAPAPAAPAKTGGNVGILAALAAGAYFLFGRK